MGEKRIYKYSLDALYSESGWSRPMPKGARVLSAGVQNDEIVVWAIVDIDAGHVMRRFKVVPTGAGVNQRPEYWTLVGVNHPPEYWAFIQTIFMGPLVFHIFDLGETSGAA